MLKTGEKDAASLLTATAYELSKTCIRIYMHQSEDLIRQKLSKELIILFLQDDCYRYYYIPSYDFTIGAKDGEPLDLIKDALPVLSYVKGFEQDYDKKTKKYRYSPDTVSLASSYLCKRIQNLLNKAEKKGANFNNWKTVECMVLESLNRRPIKI